MRPWTAFAPAVVAVLLGTGLAPASAAADDTVLHGARLTDLGPGLDSPARYTVLQLEVDLSDPDGLAEELVNYEDERYPVAFASIDPTGFVEPTPSDVLAGQKTWDVLRQVSGSSTAGTWRSTVAVSSISTGRVRLDTVVVTDDNNDVTSIAPPSTVSVVLPTTQDSAPWTFRPATVVKVVTGAETWRPSMRLTTRSGVPVAGARTVIEDPGPRDGRWYGVPAPVYPYPRTFGGTAATGADGVFVEPVAYPLGREPYIASLGAYGRGTSRHSTLMALGVALPLVKWQASGSFAAGPGEVVTVTGNAFPAPVLYRAANPNVHLQRLVGRTWRTEATGRVRDNGRFTVAWDAPDAAGYWVRVYKPGGTDANGWSEGTAGPPVWVATP